MVVKLLSVLLNASLGGTPATCVTVALLGIGLPVNGPAGQVHATGPASTPASPVGDPEDPLDPVPPLAPVDPVCPEDPESGVDWVPLTPAVEPVAPDPVPVAPVPEPDCAPVPEPVDPVLPVCPVPAPLPPLDPVVDPDDEGGEGPPDAHPTSTKPSTEETITAVGAKARKSIAREYTPRARHRRMLPLK